MPTEGFDTSYDKPTGAEASAAGLRNVMLYITDPGPGNKGITQEVWNDYTCQGLSIGFVWELGTDAVLKGYQQGREDATRAQHNLNALRGPSNQRPIYFAVDFNIQPKDYPTAAEYFKGVASVIGVRRTGVYGHFDICSWLTFHRLVSKRWQTYAWSDGKVYHPLDVLQYENGQHIGSGTVDRCRFYSSNWGQRAVLISKPAPKPAPRKPLPDPPRQVKITYIVKPGDTLSGIQRKYGTPVPTLMKWNHVIDANKIYAGQKLRVK